MNFELQQPSQVISLATSALIVSVDVNVWTATKQDRAISDEVTSAKNASSEAGKFTKNLLANSPDHRALLNYRQTVYNWLQRCTYPTMVSDAAFKQGDMFNRSEYPEPQELRSRFKIKLFVTKVPANDFRSNISEAIAEDLMRGYEKQVGEIIDTVMQDASERLVLFAERISNACTESTANEDGKVKRKKIYDTTITQAKELCETLKSFNLTNNNALEDARARLENALDGVTCEELRESSYARSQVKESVDDLLSNFKPLTVIY